MLGTPNLPKDNSNSEKEQGTVTLFCNPRASEVEVEESGVQDHSYLCRKFEASLGYMSLWLKKKKSKYTKHYAGSLCFLLCLIEWKLRHTTKSHNHESVKIYP